MRSMTEFESLTLFECLVRTWLVKLDKSKLNKSVTMSVVATTRHSRSNDLTNK